MRTERAADLSDDIDRATAASLRPDVATTAQPMTSGNHPDDDQTPDLDDDDRPSKTQRKKDMLKLQALGERLVSLPASRLKAVPLEERLREAIDHAREIRSHEGRRRQLQFIGRLMRSADAAAIEASLAGDDAAHARQVAAHHAAEQWRDGLINGSRRLETFVAQFPLPGALDRGPVGPDGATATSKSGPNAATLAGQVEAARGAGGNPRHARALYRALLQWLTDFEAQRT